MDDQPTQVSALLGRMREGDQAATHELYELVYPHLQRLAKAQRYRWSGDDTMGSTAIINEAYLKLANDKKKDWKNRAHFFHVAAQAMRQVLINYATGKDTDKRRVSKAGVSLEDWHVPAVESAESIVALDQALESLENMDERTAKVFSCMRLADLTIKETAEALGISVSTVKREAEFAKTWLHREVNGAEPA